MIIVFTQPVEQIKHLSPPTLELKNKCAACSRKWISYCIKAHQKRPEAHKEGIKHLQPGSIEAHNKHIIWKYKGTDRAAVDFSKLDASSDSGASGSEDLEMPPPVAGGKRNVEKAAIAKSMKRQKK